MPKVVKGDKALDFTFNSVFENQLVLSQEVKKASKTFLVFLRYYGCRICQLDMKEYTDEYQRFMNKDTQLLVVLQSTQQSLKNQTKPEDLPYKIVCDPDQKLYKLYDIHAAASKEEMGSPESAARVAIAAELGMVHGAYEGDELQLPAAFLLDDQMNLLYAHYATNVGDVPSVEEMVSML